MRKQRPRLTITINGAGSKDSHAFLKWCIARLPFLFRHRVAPLFCAMPFSADYSGCYRCKMPWSVARTHITAFGWIEFQGVRLPEGGCFPLCESCWQELRAPEDRLSYYRQLHTTWMQQNGELTPFWTQERADAHEQELLDVWPQIEAAVFSGG